MNSLNFKTVESLKSFLDRNRHCLSSDDIDLIDQIIELLKRYEHSSSDSESKLQMAIEFARLSLIAIEILK